MSTDDRHKPSLDEVAASIRNDEPSLEEIAASAARSRVRLGLAIGAPGSTIHIESCAGFQALIPAFLEGRLPSETALLLEDHSRECIPCRRALIAARTPKAVHAAGAGARKRPAYRQWLAAAAVAAVALVGAYAMWRVAPVLGADPQLKVMRVDGGLYQANSGSLVPLRPGMKVSAKRAIRTTKDGGALVMMDDGSRIEMRDRTELSVARRRDGSTVRLSGGAIIVEASPQGSGQLDVRTDDCLVAVKGTIFAVNTGTKGSRVSVVEGAVRVEADGRESLLKPGEQMTTSESVSPVDVDEEFAWSQDAKRYAQLLRELVALRKDLDARVPKPGLRYGSDLLDRMPDGTILYAAIPNLTQALVTAKQVFDEHIGQSPGLQSWWQTHVISEPSRKQQMDAAFEKIKTLGDQVGDEIVLALTQSPRGELHGPILMAEVKDKAAFRHALASDMNGVSTDASMTFEGRVVRIEFAGNSAPLNKVTVSPKRWSGSPLHAQLATAYAEGTSWLFGVDLQAITAHRVDPAYALGDKEGAEFADRLGRMGILDAQQLIVKGAENTEGATVHGEITFDQPRRGIAGWLATPAPIVAADFISADAAFAAAAVVKRPELILSEALGWMAGPGCPPDEDIAPLTALSATMGGDVAVALDGPILPVPSWKLIVEVYDPQQFQSAFEALLAHLNARIEEHGQNGRFVVEPDAVGNRTDWVVRFTGPEAADHTVRYTISDGYLVAAPGRALIDLAIDQRRSGYGLTRSAPFTALLPMDGNVNLSAFVWQHLGPTVGPLASKLSGAVSSDEMKAIEAMAEESKPRLVTAYAEEDRIVFDCKGDTGLNSVIGSLLWAHQVDTLEMAIERADSDKKPPQP